MPRFHGDRSRRQISFDRPVVTHRHIRADVAGGIGHERRCFPPRAAWHRSRSASPHRRDHRGDGSAELRRPCPLRLHRTRQRDQCRNLSRECQQALQYANLRQRDHARALRLSASSANRPACSQGQVGRPRRLRAAHRRAHGHRKSVEHAKPYGLLETEDPSAAEVFAELAERCPEDGLIAFYAIRLEAGRRTPDRRESPSG